MIIKITIFATRKVITNDNICYLFSILQKDTNAKLIKNFHYVSVRESNARMLIADNLSYEGSVYCDLDPTLLAGKEAYLKFVQKAL